MKFFRISLILMWISISFYSFSQNPFKTKWKTDNPGTSSSTSITIPTFGSGYNYNIDWDGNGIIDDYNVTGDATYDYLVPGTYEVVITGDFPQIYFNNSGDKEKLLEVSDWGDIEWRSFKNAFSGCKNLNVTTTSAPDLSLVTDMSYMFFNCRNLNQNFNSWDVSNVTNMLGMFRLAEIFNGDITNWDVQNVQDMTYMFLLAKNFNQPIGNWDVSSVQTMNQMFNSCINFNQNLNNWEVSNVKNMAGMFANCENFNSPLNLWGPKLQNVITMRNMFLRAEVFNQNLSNWDVSSVTDMHMMFYKAYAFDQDLGSWNVSNILNLTDMFGGGSGLSVSNYDNTLIGWSNLSLQPNVNFGAGNSQYCIAVLERSKMMNGIISNWTITDAGNGCAEEAFITKWKTDNPGSSADNQITIPTAGIGYNYHIDWESDGIYDDFNVTGDITHTYDTPGEYTVSIVGDFPRIYFHTSSPYYWNLEKDNKKIIDIIQWGNIEWTTMNFAFSGCLNMTMSASDIPDLSGVGDMSGMFYFCELFNGNIGNWDVSTIYNMWITFWAAENFNGNIGSWDVSNVVNMRGMLAFTHSFNQPIGNWDVGAVNNMSMLFYASDIFNQDISSWDVSNVNDMSSMFTFAVSFNQDISSWNVGNVFSMQHMFDYASSFNQPIGNWDVHSVNNMKYMFNSATSFDQNLGAWDVSNVYYMDLMFGNGSGLSQANYDATLIGWNNLSLQQNVTFDAGNSQFCSAANERLNITNSFNWIINDAGIGSGCRISNPQNDVVDFDKEVIAFSVYPNPASTNVTISLENNTGSETVEILDYTGKIVVSEKMNSNTQVLDIQHLSNGVYFVKVISGNDVKVEKLVKQ